MSSGFGDADMLRAARELAMSFKKGGGDSKRPPKANRDLRPPPPPPRNNVPVGPTLPPSSRMRVYGNAGSFQGGSSGQPSILGNSTMDFLTRKDATEKSEKLGSDPKPNRKENSPPSLTKGSPVNGKVSEKKTSFDATPETAATDLKVNQKPESRVMPSNQSDEAGKGKKSWASFYANAPRGVFGDPDATPGASETLQAGAVVANPPSKPKRSVIINPMATAEKPHAVMEKVSAEKPKAVNSDEKKSETIKAGPAKLQDVSGDSVTKNHAQGRTFQDSNLELANVLSPGKLPDLQNSAPGKFQDTKVNGELHDSAQPKQEPAQSKTLPRLSDNESLAASQPLDLNGQKPPSEMGGINNQPSEMGGINNQPSEMGGSTTHPPAQGTESLQLRPQADEFSPEAKSSNYPDASNAPLVETGSIAGAEALASLNQAGLNLMPIGFGTGQLIATTELEFSNGVFKPGKVSRHLVMHTPVGLENGAIAPSLGGQVIDLASPPATEANRSVTTRPRKPTQGLAASRWAN